MIQQWDNDRDAVCTDGYLFLILQEFKKRSCIQIKS